MGRVDSRRRKRKVARDEVRYKRKSVRVLRRRQDSVRAKWENRGWEFEEQRDRRFRTDLAFKRALPQPRWRLRIGFALVALLAIVGVVVGGLRYLPQHEPTAAERAQQDAAVALRTLRGADLAALGEHLAAHRGNRDFAYYFAAQATPRELGDALASVAGAKDDEPLGPDVDSHEYDITLTDLAGVLALATHGTGDRMLPPSWTEDFATATTTPEVLYGAPEENPDADAEQRADQDVANKQNLLLLLSRGYWSTEFLETVTDAYWTFDRDEGDDAWPGVADGDAKYAPAPTGTYLTDGILALTAALTANPEASAWAFTEFQPGTETITYDDDDQAIGKFTHYLFFEHEFPGGSDEGSVGMTASLTALSSAIDATSDPSGEPDSSAGSPMADSRVLEGLANSLQDQSECSWNPLDYGHCVVEAVEAAFHWVKRWGHSVLNILSLATFVPPPFNVIGVGAAATNATWYAIEGDYTNAGLSLAAAVPGLAFTKLVKSVKATKSAGAAAAAEKVAAQADDVARVANEIRAKVGTGSTITRPVTTDYLRYRPTLRSSTKDQIREAAPKNSDGDFIDPNTGQVVPAGAADIGHKPGHEWRCMKEKAVAQAWSVQEFLDYINDPELYQMEDPASNRSHQYESDVCAV